MTADTAEPVAGSKRPLKASKSSSVVVPHPSRWHQRLGAWAIYLLVQMVSATLRYRWIDQSGFFDKPPVGQAIYCVWHNRQAM